MKTLIAICFGVCFQFFTVRPTVAVPQEASAAQSAREELCTLSITGYATFEEIGRIRVTMRAQGETCEEAAAELRAEVIRRQLSIEQ